MGKNVQTYELVNMLKRIKNLQLKDMTASGVVLSLTHLDNEDICEFEFIGDMLPKLLPVIQDSIEETLKFRLAGSKRDVINITKELGLGNV